MKSQTGYKIKLLRSVPEIPQYLNPEYLLLKWDVGQFLSGGRAGATTITLKGKVIWGSSWEGRTLVSNFAIRSSYVFSWMIRCRQKEYYAESNDLCHPSTLTYLLQGYVVSRATYHGPLQAFFYFLLYQVLVIKDERWWFQMTVWIANFWKEIKCKTTFPTCPCPPLSPCTPILISLLVFPWLFWFCEGFVVGGFFCCCERYLELPVGLISWLFCQMLGSSTDICVYMNNCFLITCQEAIIFHCNPPGFN